MKTRIFLLVCLFMVIGLTRLSAQNSRDVYNWPVPASVVNLDVYCDGQLVDQVQNTSDYILKCRDKYKDGVWIEWNQHLNNVTFKSLWTGELFVIEGHEKGEWDPTVGYGEFTTMLRGNKGNHYIFRITYELDPITWELTETSNESICK